MNKSEFVMLLDSYFDKRVSRIYFELGINPLKQTLNEFEGVLISSIVNEFDRCVKYFDEMEIIENE